MRIALSEMVVEGILTNIPLHRELMIDAALHARAAPASTISSRSSRSRCESSDSRAAMSCCKGDALRLVNTCLGYQSR